MKSLERASKSSSLEAGLVARTSSMGSTRPRPRKLPKTRLTMLRTKSVERHGGAVEGGGLERFEEARMVDVAGGFGEDDVVGGGGAVLDADAGEEVGELVILLLRPLLHGVVVAAGAGEALAEEGLGDVFGQSDGVFVEDEIVKGAVGAGRAGACEDVAGEFVPVLVVLDGVADPVVEGPHGGRAEFAGGDEEKVRVFVGPVVGELFAFEETVDESGAFVGACVGEELFGFFGGGEDAGGVEEGAADEDGVCGEFAGSEA
jgi:hypothetical protein